MPTLYKYQEQCLSDLLAGKRMCVIGTGLGKAAISVVWAKQTCKETSKSKVLVITTASKRSSGDYLDEADTWCGDGWRDSLDAYEVISWHALHKWVNAHWNELDEWVYIADEVAAIKNGVSSQRGRAFLRIAKQTKDWAGFTATPGDSWIQFYPYFTACNLVRNKTSFKARYVSETHYKGYPEIIGYRHEEELMYMWKKISTSPDTSQATKELPPETHKTITFKKPAGYDKMIKTRVAPNGEWLDSTMKLCHTLRQHCFTKEKQQWISDFLENLGTNAIIFYTYKEEGDILCDIGKKALPKGSRVWRIDGSHHIVPKMNELSKYDVVLCQWQSGSEGINFQGIDYFIATTPQYSYSTKNQAEGRIQRIGAERPKFYYELMCEKTIEEDVYKTLSEKRDFSELVWGTEKGIDNEAQA